MTSQAEMIIKPFATNPVYANDSVLVEYAKILLQKGDLKGAQSVAQEAFIIGNSPQSQMVWVWRSMRGTIEAAENHFRKALEKSKANLNCNRR